jgi:hypothetical protein
MKTVRQYRVIFDNDREMTVHAKGRAAAFHKAKKLLIKKLGYDSTLVDEMARQGFQNARIIMI